MLGGKASLGFALSFLPDEMDLLSSSSRDAYAATSIFSFSSTSEVRSVSIKVAKHLSPQATTAVDLGNGQLKEHRVILTMRDGDRYGKLQVLAKRAARLDLLCRAMI